MSAIDFYNGKRVFITGHTGFKGSWLSKMLIDAGAQLTGYALVPQGEPNLFSLSGIERDMASVTGDVRDYDALQKAISQAQPEIVVHLAAQPLVRSSYKDPLSTYQTNVMGTVNVLECVRAASSVKSFLNVTTDKVYLNNEQPDHGFVEDDPLDGFDPYSNSKSCSELVTHCYRNSFFAEGSCAISTARAGNVIGGGDFSLDRIIPDCVRAALAGETIAVRNPSSIRPYQHVLEPLFAYLMIIQTQYENAGLAGWYNIGPDDVDCVTTEELVTLFCEAWGEGLMWKSSLSEGPHEAGFLKLDNTKLRRTFGWQARWRIRDAVEKTVEWTKTWTQGGDIASCMERQIAEFEGAGTGN